MKIRHHYGRSFNKRTANIIFFILAAAGIINSNESHAQTQYTVGPEDHISLKVWDVRNGDPYQWIALNGEFVVGADGHLSLPLIGDLSVSGFTTGELAAAISEHLKSKIGLSTTPTASAQIVKYRPFYITGAVQRPGKYDYVPSLTVIQAVSIAEGVMRARDTERVEKEIIAGSGEAQLLEGERIGLLAKQSRLNAEIDGRPEINYSEDLIKNNFLPSVKLAMQQETSLFKGRRNAIEAQLATINQAKNVLRSQLSSLEAKDGNLSRQLLLTRKDLSTVNELATKGMVIAQRQLSAEQNVAALESNKLDIELATLKAQQDLSQAERDIVTLTTKFKTDALTEITEVRSRLEANRKKIDTANNLTKEATRFSDSGGSSENDRVITYGIIRASSGKSLPADTMTRLEPGDVLQVKIQSKGQSSFTGPIAKVD
jgi:protein involved in polysaccharide export with SLBB domain